MVGVYLGELGGLKQLNQTKKKKTRVSNHGTTCAENKS